LKSTAIYGIVHTFMEFEMTEDQSLPREPQVDGHDNHTNLQNSGDINVDPTSNFPNLAQDPAQDTPASQLPRFLNMTACRFPAESGSGAEEEGSRIALDQAQLPGSES
jgi:hypothetical protein